MITILIEEHSLIEIEIENPTSEIYNLNLNFKYPLKLRFKLFLRFPFLWIHIVENESKRILNSDSKFLIKRTIFAPDLLKFKIKSNAKNENELKC